MKLSAIQKEYKTVLKKALPADDTSDTNYIFLRFVVDFLPKVKIDVAVDDSQLDAVLDAIGSAANTGKIGDGKIFVTELGQVVRIRTRETGADAI